MRIFMKLLVLIAMPVFAQPLSDEALALFNSLETPGMDRLVWTTYVCGEIDGQIAGIVLPEMKPIKEKLNGLRKSTGCEDIDEILKLLPWRSKL